MSMNCTGAVELDGDIAGTGVRISFYVQNLLLVLLMNRSHEDAENALWTFVATSFGLTVAAFSQLRNGHLTLIDGIIVSQLVWFANLGIFLALASYSRSKGKDVVIKIAATVQGYLSMVLTIAMWALSNMLPFGSCDSIKFVFMFAVELPAPSSGRVIALIFASLVLAAFTVLNCIEVWVWVKQRRLGLHETGMADVPDLETDFSHEQRRTRPTHHGHKSHDAAKQHHPSHNRFHRHWAGSLHRLGSFFFGIFLSQVLILVYFISTTELIIRNATLKPATWTFGQVLALTVVLPSCVALLRVTKDKWSGDSDTHNNPDLRSNIANGRPGSALSIPLSLRTRRRAFSNPSLVRSDLASS